MATYEDPRDVLITLLTNSWNSANTDSKTPVFGDIETYGKVMNLAVNDYILLYNLPQRSEPVGIGNDAYANIYETVKLDVRVYDMNADDTHAKKVLAEMLRILHLNRLNVSPFCELDPFGDLTPHADKMRKIYRWVKQVQLIERVRDMTA